MPAISFLSTAYRRAAVVGLTALLFSPPALAQLSDISGIQIGDSVEVFFGNMWLPATVVELHGGYLRATFTDARQHPATLTETFQPIFLRLSGGQPPAEPTATIVTQPAEGAVQATGFVDQTPRPTLASTAGTQVGDLIEVFFGGIWLAARVVEVHDGYLSATFDDERQYPATLTESFQPNFLRLPKDPMQHVGQPALAPVAEAPAFLVDEQAAAAPPAAPPDAANPPVPAGSNDFAGDWILHTPGVAYIRRTYEEAPHGNEMIGTDWLVTAAGASGSGAVRIAPDGTYRMQFLDEKWEGRWRASQDRRGGIHLEHPLDANQSWHLFVAAEDGQPRALCATCTGESYETMERIPADLAERLVAPVDVGVMVGRWALWFQKWESGFVEIHADGTYQLDADGQKAEGRWVNDGEHIRFPGAFGHDGWFQLRNGNPDEAVLVGAVTELRALRR